MDPQQQEQQEQQKQPPLQQSFTGQQEMTEMVEQQGPGRNNNVIFDSNNNVVQQYVLVGEENQDPLVSGQEQIWQQQEQHESQQPPPPPPQQQPQGSWVQDQYPPSSIYQEQQQFPPSDPYSNHLNRSRTCPPLDLETVHNLENNGQGDTASQARFYGPDPLNRGRFHGERLEQEPWDESTATCFSRARHRIGEVIETKIAHIIILCLTVVDIVLVMLQIGASLLHLDETEEEDFIIALFGHLSLAIVSVFMLEVLLKCFASGPRYFMPGTKHWFLHLLDAVIILTSFLLEIFLKGVAEELSSLLIVFRLWRVIKLTGTVAIEVSEHDEQKVKVLEQRIATLEQELQASQLQVQRLQAFNRGGYQDGATAGVV